MSVTRKKSRPPKAARKSPLARPEPSPALKAQLEASIKEHGYVTAKTRGHLVVCEEHELSELAENIKGAMWPVSDYFLEDFKGITGALFHLRRSLEQSQDTALVDFCIRSIDRKVEVITKARDNCLAATQVALHPEWHALPEALERAMR